MQIPFERHVLPGHQRKGIRETHSVIAEFSAVPFHRKSGGRDSRSRSKKRNRAADRLNRRQPIIGLIEKEPSAFRKSRESLSAPRVYAIAKGRAALVRRDDDEIVVRVLLAPCRQKLPAPIG